MQLAVAGFKVNVLLRNRWFAFLAVNQKEQMDVSTLIVELESHHDGICKARINRIDQIDGIRRKMQAARPGAKKGYR